MSKKMQSAKKEKEVVEDVEVLTEINDDEPSWYHYLLVFVIMGLIFLGIYGIYYFVEGKNFSEPINNQSVLIKYPYKVGNITYNLYFENSFEELENMDVEFNLNKLDLLNTQTFTMSFLEYNGTDNGQVSKGSTKLVSFLRLVYNFKFDEGSFVMHNVTNCTSSSLENKVIVFNPYSDKEGVFYNSTNGCIEFLTYNATHTVDLVDKFMYEIIVKNEK